MLYEKTQSTVPRFTSVSKSTAAVRGALLQYSFAPSFPVVTDIPSFQLLSTETPWRSCISNLRYAMHLRKQLLLSSKEGTGKEFLAHLTSYSLETLMQLRYTNHRARASEDVIKSSSASSQPVNPEIRGQSPKSQKTMGRCDSQHFRTY